jgi:hypothetical protein
MAKGERPAPVMAYDQAFKTTSAPAAGENT